MRKIIYAILLITSSLSAKEESKTTTVESNDARYDGNQILLSGKVTIRNVMGTVTSQRAILKRDPDTKCKIDFPWLELVDHVEAHLADGSTLTCDKVIFDYVKMRSDFSGPSEIHYKDPRGEVYAREAFVEYEECGSTIEPVKITLFGNVRMIHKEPTQQYALADRVEYSPREEVVVLTAKENERVLFYDLTKGVQLSATAVKARRSGEQGKESIQGIGDVCFVFKEEELNKLKDRFQWK